MSEQPHYVFSNFILGFTDLLGQREHFRDQGLLPDLSTEAAKTAFTEVTRATVGSVLRLHEDAVMFVNSLEEKRWYASLTLTDDQRPIAEKMRQHNLRSQPWSDGFVYYVNVGDDKIAVPMNGVYGLITSLSTLALLGLARGQPIRGGIDVAWATEIRPGQVYGCAVAKAYELESEVAKYPRIVVGPRVVEYLQQYGMLRPRTIYEDLSRQLSAVTIRFIATDTDGAFILDYLGPMYRSQFSGRAYDDMCAAARTFVTDSVKKWRQSGNDALLERYNLLDAYFTRNGQ